MQSITNLAKDGKDKLIYPIQIIRLATEKQFRKRDGKYGRTRRITWTVQKNIIAKFKKVYAKKRKSQKR